MSIFDAHIERIYSYDNTEIILNTILTSADRED